MTSLSNFLRKLKLKISRLPSKQSQLLFTSTYWDAPRELNVTSESIEPYHPVSTYRGVKLNASLASSNIHANCIDSSTCSFICQGTSNNR